MKRTTLVALTLATVTGLGASASAQSVSSAQCEQMMMAGLQAYPAATVAACQPHYQAMADRAAAQGTFATPGAVTLSTSGSGG